MNNKKVPTTNPLKDILSTHTLQTFKFSAEKKQLKSRFTKSNNVIK